MKICHFGSIQAARQPPVLERYMLAAASVLLVCAAVLFVWGRGPGKEQAILRQASTRMPAILKVGLGAHLHCAVFRSYSNQPEDVAQIEAQLGPYFSGLLQLVRAHMPAAYRILEGHRCTAGGREYIHLIMAGGRELVSLLLTRERAGEALNGGLSQSGIDRFQVVGFDSRDYLLYVVSDLDAQHNLQLAADLAPALRSYLTAHQG